MLSPEDTAESLMLKLGPIPEYKMRTAVLADAIKKMDDSTAAEVMKVILERGGQRIPQYHYGLQSLNDLPDIIRHIGTRKMAGIYRASRELGYEDVSRMLRKIPARKHASDAPQEIYVDKELQDVALGMRKTMGRIGDRDLVNRLLHDQDPAVIEQVLNNPGLTEDQVVRIAAKRPTADTVLRNISQSNKWGRRYRIQMTLLSNPYTPTEISVRLVGLMLQQDLVDISNDTALHVEVRNAAFDILKNK